VRGLRNRVSSWDSVVASLWEGPLGAQLYGFASDALLFLWAKEAVSCSSSQCAWM
jgi:hypothetical protein